MGTPVRVGVAVGVFDGVGVGLDVAEYDECGGLASVLVSGIAPDAPPEQPYNVIATAIAVKDKALARARLLTLGPILIKT